MTDKTTMLDYVDNWMEVFKTNDVKDSSYMRLTTSRNTMSKYFIANKPIGEISFFDIQRYINELVKDGYAMSTLKKLLRIVTAPIKQAAALRIISADPSVGVKLPSESKVKKKAKDILAYDKAEQERILKEVKAHQDIVGYLAVWFMIETGIRAGELLALKWNDIDISSCKMRIHATILNPMNNSKSRYQDSPKTASSNRVIPLTPKALAVLKILLGKRKTEWVFEKDGQQYTYKKLMYQTKKLCRACGVQYYGEHAFRHTFATNCYYKGIDVKILSRLLGHSSTQVTYNTYINLYGDGFDAMYAALCL